MGKKKIDINAKKGVDVNRVMEAAGLLKDSVVDEQAKKIKMRTKKESYLCGLYIKKME